MTSKKITIQTGTGVPDGSPGLLVRVIRSNAEPELLARFTLTPEQILRLLRGDSVGVEVAQDAT